MKIRHVTTCLAAASLAVLLVGCGGTSSSSTANDAGGSGSPAAGTAGPGGAGSVTIYSADGLADWYTPQFAAFTKASGIKVNYVEAGSSEVVSRVEKERSNPQADVLITLPPFIQQADKDGILGSLGVDTTAVPATDKASNGRWTSVVNNYSGFIVNNKQSPKPTTWDDLLGATYAGKLQYSTPGQAGDGTALLVLLQHQMGKAGALDYLKKLQKNNVGPSSSTGKLQPKVSIGSLLVANGDVQMNLTSIANDKSNFSVIFPANGTAKPETLALPYAMGLTASAPHSANGQKLMTFLLAKQAQQQVSAQAFGLPVRSDVTPTDANYTATIKAVSGVTIYHPDWDTVLAELNSDVAAYNNATGA